MNSDYVVFAALFLAFAPSPASAASADAGQDAAQPANTAPASEEPARMTEGQTLHSEDEVDQLHLPGYDGTRSGSSVIEFEIAPEIASHNPLGSESRTSSSTATALTFITVQPLSDSLELEFDAGPSMLFEHGDITESSLAAALELRTTQNESGFAGFARYGVSHDMDKFFGSGIDTSQTLSGGVRYGTDVGPGAIGFELAPRWVNSNHNLDDYLAGELFIDAYFPVIDNGIGLIGEFSADRRWYLNADAAVPGKRRDWRFEAFLGLDFADALAPSSGKANPLHALGIGVLWLEVDSNLDSADRSTFKILPALTVGLSL